MNCKAKVHDYFGVGFHQCTRKATKGGYCYQHHPDAVKKRREESDRKYQERMEQDPFTLWMRCQERCEALEAEVERLREWINDLQSGMYVNCVYCGHRYGPREETPVAMADVLKEHIENCPKHPMNAMKAEIKLLRTWVAARVCVNSKEEPCETRGMGFKMVDCGNCIPCQARRALKGKK